MALGEHFRASIFMQTVDGSTFVNNFGYHDGGAGSTHIDTSTAAGDFQTMVQALYATALPDNVNIYHYRFACVWGAHLGEVGFVDVNPLVPGTQDSSANFPNEICISMKRSTGYAARTERGRIFFGPVSVVFADAGGNPNRCATPSGPLSDIANLLKSNLLSSGRVLNPILLDSVGNSTEHQIINATYALQFVHRRSRRPTVGA